MKKRFALFLACWLLLTASAAAAGPPSLSVTPSAPQPAVGETFTVEVSIAGNPGFNAVQFTLVYDKTALVCTDVSAGTVLQGAMSAGNPDGGSGAIVAAASVSPLTEDGALAVFTFRTLRAGAPVFQLADCILADQAGRAMDFTLTGAGQTSAPAGAGTSGIAEPSFPDTAGHWAEASIRQAAKLGLFGGYADGTFRPDRAVSRGEFALLLWRMAGQPAASDAVPFTDLAGAQCRQAVAWAYQAGYVSGKTATLFAPNAPLTRQAAMKLLFLFNGGTRGQETLFTAIYDDAFADSDAIAPWGKAPMYWAFYHQLLSGTSDTTLSPGGIASRAQMAKILVNYTEKFAASAGEVKQ